jgi:hypothetical protein
MPMIVVSPTERLGGSRSARGAKLYASLLEKTYRDLLDESVPEHLARLVQRLAESDGERRRRSLG